MQETAQQPPLSPSPFNESDFERAETERALWSSLHEAAGWPSFARTVDGMLAGWRASLETLPPESVSRVQGMIAGARIVLTLVAAKIAESEQHLETMRQQNEAHSASEREEFNA